MMAKRVQCHRNSEYTKARGSPTQLLDHTKDGKLALPPRARCFHEFFNFLYNKINMKARNCIS